MLSIGTKKYRNLQEQVAYNTECIKKLDEYLDGITIEDKLVVIESDSGTFTDEELVILSAPLAFISDGSKVWMKQSETLVQLVFKAIDVVATEVGGAYFNLGLSQIVINRETGAYNSSADTFFTTYSKSQIDSIVANIMAVKANASDVYTKTATDNLLADKANLAGANFTGAVTAPTLKQSNANYSYSFNMTGANATLQTLTFENIYNRCQEINGRLSIVCNFKVTNQTGSAINIPQDNAFSSNLVLSSDIASKIYDLLGDPASQSAQQAFVLITTMCSVWSKGYSYSASKIANNCLVFNRNVANQIGILTGPVTAFNLNDSESLYVSARVLIDLI